MAFRNGLCMRKKDSKTQVQWGNGAYNVLYKWVAFEQQQNKSLLHFTV